MSVIEGLQSSSFLGIMCNNKSLPSAREGVQNYIKINKKIVPYLSPCGDQGRLEGEFIPKKYFKIEAVNGFVQRLRPLDCRSFNLKLKRIISQNIIRKVGCRDQFLSFQS